MNRKKRIGVISLFSILLIAAVGCGNQEDTQPKSNTLKVVTTFYPMYDFTKNVAGDKAEITMLLEAGTDTHGYEPSAKEVTAISDADVFIYNSEEMEVWVPSVLDSIDTENTVVVNASEGISLLESTEDPDEHEAEEQDHEAEEQGHEVDPHIWLDPVLAQEEVSNIKEGLIAADPENKDVYETNAIDYNEKLQALDQEFEMAFSGATKRTFVTQHAAFAYLADRYNLEQVSIAGISTEQEPSPAKLAELQDYVKENDINYIYYAEASSSQIAETLANETGTQLEILNPVEGITTEDQEKGIDYIQVMKNNLAALQKSIN
ncbi:metal ABC transporter substrate-binding protein [Carnobacterium alterfunditum]|uniref:metal ABC transporter substrate-binding protein n=1 Tax=Carnobacterium alterfunditum TaxID=28230 RepID=UPI0035930584